MNEYFALEPEVAGGWGETTIADQTQHPPIVSKLHYEFDVWLGDDLLEGFACYIVTERLYKALQQSKMTGFSFDEVTITTSGIFDDIQESLETNLVLPKFCWLKVDGKAGEDDLGILNTLHPVERRQPRSTRRSRGPTYTGEYQLVVSARALQLLREFNLEHCTIRQFKN